MICNACPRQCGVDRDKVLGACKMSNIVRVAKIMVHSWEEPPMPESRAGGPGGASRGAVAAQAQEGLEELSRVESQEPRW